MWDAIRGPPRYVAETHTDRTYSLNRSSLSAQQMRGRGAVAQKLQTRFVHFLFQFV